MSGKTRLSPAAKLPELSLREEKAVEAQSRPSAALIHETIRAEGESELDRTTGALLLSGLAAGLTMGLSLVAQGLLHARLPDAPWRELVVAFGYTIGFLIVILGRQQLFTENTLTPVLSLLYHRDARTLSRVLRLWALVLVANLAGTWFIAIVLAHGGVFGPDIAAAFDTLSRPAVAAPFWTTVLKAVFAGWLIATMAWLLPGSGSSPWFVIVALTYVVAVGQFAHVVAGSVDAFYLFETGELTLSGYATRFLLPTLIGNVIGGVALVAALNYGQAAPEVEPAPDAGA
ncbi:formate/nitrite transporter family protein [Alsobacter sp. SYSU M60028]|uniref:Formate/nitrite transporter family protein n=1 Tax=Alsobacter ponti TaxID=2962936 RepID=A0ABT1LAH1_9HYPH|nr:formate/nitrite transporter family protein [Alsobacter ponti]MCP8938439.1 formate/nitrite transporter family protein [Alsobacter ponti]